MNTSEIKPLHLAVPRTRGRPPQPTQPNIEKPKAEETGQRFLSQRYSGRRADGPSRDSPPPPPPVQAVPTALVEAAQRVTVAIAPDPKPATDQLLKDKDFWLYPLPTSTVALFSFRVDSGQMPWQFSLLQTPDGAPILTATMGGPTRAHGVSVAKPDGHIIAEGRLDRPGNVVFFVSSLNGDPGESCAGVFTKGRLSDVIIPAIKKIEGRNRMCAIRTAESSALFLKVTQKAKEAIRLKVREPPGDGDLTFGGKFEVPSLANFVLYHESKTSRDLCSFGMCKNGLYVIEVGYPLAPMQAFIAAICASMPT